MNSPIVFRMNGVGDWILLGALLFWFVCNYLGQEDKMSNERIGGFFIVLGLIGFAILFILEALGLGHF